MRRRILIGIAVLFAPIVFGLSAVGQEKAPLPGAMPADVVATVNGETITRKELADELIDFFGRPALERMIRLKLVEQEARKYGVDVTPEEVKTRLDAGVQEMVKGYMSAGGLKDEAELDRFLQQSQGITLDTAISQTKAKWRLLVRADVLAEKILRKIVTVSPEDIRAAYENKYGTTIRARQIVLPTRGEAEEVLAKLKAGADFELMAREKSMDAATRAKGGEMRPLSASTKLGRAVEAIQPGGLSEIVRTDDGYHILKVIERHEKQKVKFEDVQAQLREEILKQRVDERKTTWQTQLLEQAEVKVNL